MRRFLRVNQAYRFVAVKDATILDCYLLKGVRAGLPKHAFSCVEKDAKFDSDHFEVKLFICLKQSAFAALGSTSWLIEYVFCQKVIEHTPFL